MKGHVPSGCNHTELRRHINRAVNRIVEQLLGTVLWGISVDFFLFYRSSLANLAVLNFPKKLTQL